MQIRSAALGAAVLMALTLGAMRWMAPAPGDNGQPGMPAVPAQPAAAPIMQASPAAPLAPVAAAAQSKQPQGANWRAMREKFAHATSLRAFYFDALRNPQDGGFYYAMNVIGVCGELKQPDGPVPARRQQALDALRARCDFSQQELDDAFQQFGAMRNLALTDDPLLRDMFAKTKADNAAAESRIIREALDHGNPEVIASMAAPAVKVRLGQATIPDADELALLLLSCRLGADCGPDSAVMLKLCVQRGWCGDSIDAALRDGLGADYLRLDRASNEVIDDLRKRNLGALLKVR